jgi:hypothetical protein
MLRLRKRLRSLLRARRSADFVFAIIYKFKGTDGSGIRNNVNGRFDII